MAKREVVDEDVLKQQQLRDELCNREPSLIELIQPGDRVTIVKQVGAADRFGNVQFQKFVGRAIMRSSLPNAWVLNMGGTHGRPDIATYENVVRVQGPSGGGNKRTMR